MQTENKLIHCSWCKYFRPDRYHKQEGYCESTKFNANVYAVSGHISCPVTVTIAFGCIFGEEKKVQSPTAGSQVVLSKEAEELRKDPKQIVQSQIKNIFNNTVEETVLESIIKPTITRLSKKAYREAHQQGKWKMSEGVLGAMIWLVSEVAELYKAYMRKEGRVEEELSDVIILALSIAGRMDIDIGEEIIKKMEKNRTQS